MSVNDLAGLYTNTEEVGGDRNLRKLYNDNRVADPVISHDGFFINVGTETIFPMGGGRGKGMLIVDFVFRFCVYFKYYKYYYTLQHYFSNNNSNTFKL